MVQQQIYQWRTHVALNPHHLTQIYQWRTHVALNPHHLTQIYQWRTRVTLNPYRLTQIHQWKTRVTLNPHDPILHQSNRKLSRTNLVVITTSHLIVALVSVQASRFHSSNVQAHIDDLQPIVEASVKQGKTVLILTVDGGPDWSTY